MTTISNRTFGIEIECLLPRGSNRDALAVAIQQAGIAIQVQHYNHNTQSVWKIVTDGSLGDYQRGIEVVSPVLFGPEGIRQVRLVANVMEAFGCKVTVRGGVHVHVGAGDLNLAQLRRVAKNYIKFETFFDHVMPMSRRADRNSYVLSNRSVFGAYRDEAAVNRGFDAIDAARNRHDLIAAVSGRTRYRKLNLFPLETYGTIEFRQHSGTVDADKLANWILLVTEFVEKSAKSSPRKRTITEMPTPSQELTRFFKMFSSLKSVQKFYRARMKHFAARPGARR